MSIEYVETAWFEMKPDVYGGDNFDEHIPMWYGYVDGDKDGDTLCEPLTFNSEHFPPGTKITVKVPECPKCEMDYDLCNETDCDFNWKEWTENQYS